MKVTVEFDISPAEVLELLNGSVPLTEALHRVMAEAATKAVTGMVRETLPFPGLNMWGTLQHASG